jgi:hypothetical protein
VSLKNSRPVSSSYSLSNVPPVTRIRILIGKRTSDAGANLLSWRLGRDGRAGRLYRKLRC